MTATWLSRLLCSLQSASFVKPTNDWLDGRITASAALLPFRGHPEASKFYLPNLESISGSSLPFPSTPFSLPPFLPTFLPYFLPPYFFTVFFFPSCPLSLLPFPFHIPFPLLFPLPLSPHPSRGPTPLVQLRCLGERCKPPPPKSPSRAWPPNSLWCMLR